MTRREAMAVMYASDERGLPVPFDVTFVTLSTTRRTGGDVRTLRGVVTTGSAVQLQRSRMVNVVPVQDKGQRRGTEHHIHLCLILAVNDRYF